MWGQAMTGPYVRGEGAPYSYLPHCIPDYPARPFPLPPPHSDRGEVVLRLLAPGTQHAPPLPPRTVIAARWYCACSPQAPSMPLALTPPHSDRGEVVLRLLAPGTQMAALIGPKGDTIRQVRGPGKGWIGAVEGWDERDTRKGVRVRCGRCAAQGGG